MPRPRKCRKVCSLPKFNMFRPEDIKMENIEPVTLTVDEYESVRLIDNENLSQEECCGYMAVSRTTVQEIYASARKKIADALVNGRPLLIRGGDYRLCDGKGQQCGGNGCYRKRHGCGGNRNE